LTEKGKGMSEEITELQARIAKLESERGQLLDQILHLEEQFLTIFEQSGETIVVIDPATLKIIGANQNAARRLGYTVAQLLEKKIGEIEQFPAENLQEVGWKSTASGTNFYECLYRHANGKLIPVEVSSRAGKFGAQRVLINFVRDVTRRKEAEQEREQLIEELRAFSHTVAHDLKSPLSVVVGFVDLLKEQLQESELSEMVMYIQNTTYKMITIIDELLLLANMRATEQVELSYLNMDEIMTSVSYRLRYQLESENATLITPSHWHTAIGYAPWIEEVWTNYISNAIKYGGQPPKIEVGSEANNGMVNFWVKDNGAGIAPDQLDTLFKPFVRLDNIRATGHGLGLSIVRRIIERLNGEVGVDSQQGIGSVFYFRLPAR
jgi:PAS domain S-box-containing protein